MIDHTIQDDVPGALHMFSIAFYISVGLSIPQETLKEGFSQRPWPKIWRTHY
jgi:hypothetical protein